MGWTAYIVIIFIFASLFFVGAAFALHWAYKNRQLENLEEGARSIFDEEEPEGEIQDAFPSKRTKSSS